MKASLQLILFLFQLINGSNQGEEPFSRIEKGFAKGDIEVISDFLKARVEINYKEEKSLYTKKEAKQLINTFFTTYPPRLFEYQHKGEPKKGIYYFIGNYKHKEGAFTIYLLVREEGKKVFIETIDIN